MIWDKLFKSSEKNESDKVFDELYEVLHKREFTMNGRDRFNLENAIMYNNLEAFKRYLMTLITT